MTMSEEHEAEIVDYFRHLMYGAHPPARHYDKTRVSIVKRDQIMASQFSTKKQFLLYRVPYVQAYCLCTSRDKKSA